MSIDPNELAAWLRRLDNLPFLLEHEVAVRARITELLKTQELPANFSGVERPRPWPGRRAKCDKCGR